MNQVNSTHRETKGVCLLGALSRTVKAQRRCLKKKLYGYHKIRPIMTLNGDDTSDLSEVILQESSNVDIQIASKKPKRVLQFSDGVMEEYSSEDEVNVPKNNKIVSQIDTKNMKWLPWAWYQTTWLSSKMLDGCDYVGEFLANVFGITAPKYQFEINEFYRLQALQKEMFDKQDLELGGWSEQKRNNLIDNENIISAEHN